MKYSIVFPGQGSQSLGMLSNLNQNFSIINEIFQEASDAISVDLWKIINEDQEALNLTENTQPVMLAAGYATYKILSEEMSLSPVSLAGHSLGEYTALVASSSLNFFDAIRLVKKRGEVMQSAVPNGVGSMAAILGLEDDFSSLPAEFRLKQNYPNPFNPETNIDFNLPVKSDISLEIYNVLGHRINTLVNKQVSAGSHRIKWDGRDFLGRTVSAGVYFYKINAGEFTSTRKMMMVK